MRYSECIIKRENERRVLISMGKKPSVLRKKHIDRLVGGLPVGKLLQSGGNCRLKNPMARAMELDFKCEEIPCVAETIFTAVSGGSPPATA